MFEFFERNALPSDDSGLVAERTSGSLRSAETVESIPSLYFESVIFWTLGAVSSTGVLPFAWAGSSLSRRSVACWLSLPGSVRLLFRFGPTLRARTARTRNTAACRGSALQHAAELGAQRGDLGDRDA